MRRLQPTGTMEVKVIAKGLQRGKASKREHSCL